MVKNELGSMDSILLGSRSPMLRRRYFRQEGSALTEGLHIFCISPSIDFFASGEAARDHLKMKIEENSWLLGATRHHILVDMIEDLA